MSYTDSKWFKVLVFILCIAAYWGLNDWEVLSAETDTPLLIQQYIPPKAGEYPSVMPNKVHQQRAWTPEHSLTYHFFECGDYDTPAWSILMLKDGLFIIGKPYQIKRMDNFIAAVFLQTPVQLYDYEPC